MQVSAHMVIAAALVVGLVGVATFLAYRLRRAPWRYRAAAMALPASQLSALAFLALHVGGDEGGIPLLAIVVALGLACAGVDIWLLSALEAAAELGVSQEKARLAKERLLAQRAYGACLSREAAQARVVYDEVAAGLAAAESALAEGKGQEAEAGLGRLIEATAATGRVPCGHKAIAALVALKADAAQETGVRFAYDLQVPQDVGIGGFELCAVFSNLLDNALAAAAQAPEKRRFVETTAAIRGAFLVVEVRNGTGDAQLGDAQPEPDAASPDDLDALRRRHGWGQGIVRLLAERHHGFFQAEAADGIYRATVALSLVA